MTLRNRTDFIVVHVTATPPDLDIGAAEVRQMHLKRGWSDIGYNAILRRNGAREVGRGLDAIGAHVAGFNSVACGISMVGGVNRAGQAENNATDAQMTALEAWLRELQDKYPAAQICGHRDLSPDKDRDGIIEPHEHLKACPCFDAIPWARSKGLRAANIRGVWDQSAPPAPEGPNARTAFLQRLLARTGLQFGPIDGIAGPRTHEALREFQGYSGLPKTGMFDTETVAVLRARFDPAASKAA